MAAEARQIKTASARRTDRIARGNQLLRLTGQLSDLAHYSGRALSPL